MIRCKQCVIPNTRPDTHFENGVCSACRSFEQRKTIDWASREEILIGLLKRYGGRGAFDCIVPSSGGKDSHWQVLKILELGFRPLVVTATTCYLTELGRQNIDNLARYATTIEITPNRKVRARLNKLGLELVGDISWPEHVSIFTIPFQISFAFQIPLIFYGENPQNQYGGPPGADQTSEMTLRWRSEFGGFLGLRPSDMVGHNMAERDMLDYQLPEQEWAKSYFLGQFYPWDSERNAAIAMEHGMMTQPPSKANLWAYENLDNAMTGIHDHAMYRKYGYGRLAAQASVEIRKGTLAREKAMKMVEERDGLFPSLYMGVPVGRVLKHIGLTHDDLMNSLDQFTDWKLFDGIKNGRPLLKEFV